MKIFLKFSFFKVRYCDGFPSRIGHNSVSFFMIEYYNIVRFHGKELTITKQIKESIPLTHVKQNKESFIKFILIDMRLNIPCYFKS